MFSVSAAVLGVSQKVVEGVSHGEDVSSVVGSVGVGGLSSQGVLSSRNEVANGSSSTTRCTEDEDEDGDEVGDELAGRLCDDDSDSINETVGDGVGGVW